MSETGVYFGYFDDMDDMVRQFTNFWAGPEPDDYTERVRSDLMGAEVLFAAYGCPSYEGYARVLYRKNGVIYEVNGSHCSCMGLEGQWEPEVVYLPELKQRQFNTYEDFDDDAVAAYHKLMNEL